MDLGSELLVIVPRQRRRVRSPFRDTRHHDRLPVQPQVVLAVVEVVADAVAYLR
jgi:hypothetical protein